MPRFVKSEPVMNNIYVRGAKYVAGPFEFCNFFLPLVFCSKPSSFCFV